MGTPKKEQFLLFQALCNTLDIDSGKFINLYKIIFDDKTLFIAYNEILKKKSCAASLRKNNGLYLTFMNFKKFKIMVNKLKFSQYTRSVPKKILILATTATKNSFVLAVVAMTDKILDYSIYMTLLCIYKGNKVSVGRENSLVVNYRSRFCLYTHGYNKTESVYSALSDLRT